MLVHLQAQAHPSLDASTQLAIVPYRPSAMPSAARRNPEAHQGTAQEAKTTLVPRLVSVSSRTAEAWRVTTLSKLGMAQNRPLASQVGAMTGSRLVSAFDKEYTMYLPPSTAIFANQVTDFFAVVGIMVHERKMEEFRNAIAQHKPGSRNKVSRTF